MKRVVVTGGPGSGKAAFLAFARRELCAHVVGVPDAAHLLSQGGFPAAVGPEQERARVRATFHVQRELEALRGADAGVELMLCHRGTLDGSVYYPGGEGAFLADLALDRGEELARYACVLHLRPPREAGARAHELDARIVEAWRGHPHRRLIGRRVDFSLQVRDALRVVYGLLPEACRRHECALGVAAPASPANVFSLRR